MAEQREPTIYTSPHGIEVNRHAADPGLAYKMIKDWERITRESSVDPSTPISDDKVRIVCISDTHCKTKNLVLPDGDVLLHSGDFTSRGRLSEIADFAVFMKKQSHTHKVVIAGNHELSLGYSDGYCDPITMRNLIGASAMKEDAEMMKKLNISHPKELLKSLIYLNNSSAVVCGLKIWGSPWTPYFMNWAYNAYRGAEILQVWDTIPNDTDILMTHGPPLGIGDRAWFNGNVGCSELYSTVTQRVKPKLHVFGHIHEDTGMWRDGTTTYVNAATCNRAYRPTNPPMCVDIDLPAGFSKLDMSVSAAEHSEQVIERQFAAIDPEEEQATKSKMSGVFSMLKTKFVG